MEIGWIPITGSMFLISFSLTLNKNHTLQIMKTLFRWTFNLQVDRLLIGQYVTMFGDVISHVNITAVKSDDGGGYECTAISKAGSVSHYGRLNIYGNAI